MVMERRIPQDIGDNAYDLIVVGAGINGAGIAREAATRGLKVLLLDKEDFGSGTTSWSGRLQRHSQVPGLDLVAAMDEPSRRIGRDDRRERLGHRPEECLVGSCPRFAKGVLYLGERLLYGGSASRAAGTRAPRPSLR